MPYITQSLRDWLDPAIQQILYELRDSGYHLGDINYVISRILWEIFDSKPSYTLGNNLVGVLHCAQAEFIRRKLSPYEDTKIKENGDLAPFTRPPDSETNSG